MAASLLPQRNRKTNRSRTRLHSDNDLRPDDAERKLAPYRIIFLSVEGNITEGDYFNCIKELRSQLGIKAIVQVEVLTRASNDTDSSPDAVLELMEEYLTLRNDTDKFLSRLNKKIYNKNKQDIYSEEFVRKYFDDYDSLDPSMVEEFEEFCRSIKICVDYNRYLYNIRNGSEDSDDVFGIVIDRDWNSHTVSAMKEIVQFAEEEGIKCFVTNPCIEFWLLLHLVDVKTEYANQLDDFRDNLRDKNKTYTERQLSIAKKKKLGIPLTQSISHQNGPKAKSITREDFRNFYLRNVDVAIQRAKNDFSTDIHELIGREGDEDAQKGKLGSNLPELFELLREVRL